MLGRRSFLGRLWILLALGWSTTAPLWAEAPEPLTIFAASSLTDALQASGAAFTAKSSIPVRFSFASSAALARQLEAGAPADMFLSADKKWMDYVQARGLIDNGSRITLFKGRLALIAPAGSSVMLKIARGFPLARALGPTGRLATGDPDFVPVGRYARAALVSLRIWPDIANRLARTENVRVALALVARQEAPLGIVYETDAKSEPRVKIVGLFPESSHPPIAYSAALAAKAKPAATAFRAFLRSRENQAIVRRFGFILAQ